MEHRCPEDHPQIESGVMAALSLQRKGKTALAEETLLSLLERCPDHPMVMFYLAGLYQEQGELELALALLERLNEEFPDEPVILAQLGALFSDAGAFHRARAMFDRCVELDSCNQLFWYNLGAVLQKLGLFEEAAEAYQRARDLGGEDPDLLFNLGLVLARLKEYRRAKECYFKALEGAPGDPEIRYNLALIHRREGAYAEAYLLLEEIVEQNPDFCQAYSHLAAICLKLGELVRARECFQTLKKLGHDPEGAEFMLRVLEGERVDTPPRGYVQQLFDRYADGFENDLLEQLHYRVPFLLFELLRDVDGSRTFRHLLDLGCGTGLCGEVFSSAAERMTGVDIARRMVEAAREKGVYHRLVAEEVIEFCRTDRESYDCIVAADVLVYLGELKEFFEAVAARAAQGGLLLLSIENGREPLELKATGRYGHGRDYVVSLAQHNGFTLMEERPASLRREGLSWVEGVLFCFRFGERP